MNGPEPQPGEWVVRPRERVVGGGAPRADTRLGLTLFLSTDPYEYFTPFTCAGDDEVKAMLLRRIASLLNACAPIRNPAAIPDLLAALAADAPAEVQRAYRALGIPDDR